MKAYEYLNTLLSQLKDRKEMIPKYLKNPDRFLGKKDYAVKMLHGIDQEIAETKVAIAAIENFRKVKKSKSVTKKRMDL